MGLHISSWIIIHWLLVAAWLNPDKGFFSTWALAAVLLWWLAWQRHFPPFPKSPPQRMMIYVVFLGSTSMLGIFVGTLTGYLAPLLIIILLGVEMRQRARRT